MICFISYLTIYFGMEVLGDRQRRNLGSKWRPLVMFDIRILYGFLATASKEFTGMRHLLLLI
jgi:hypothetical protein